MLFTILCSLFQLKIYWLHGGIEIALENEIVVKGDQDRFMAEVSESSNTKTSILTIRRTLLEDLATYFVCMVDVPGYPNYTWPYAEVRVVFEGKLNTCV